MNTIDKIKIRKVGKLWEALTLLETSSDLMDKAEGVMRDTEGDSRDAAILRDMWAKLGEVKMSLHNRARDRTQEAMEV